VRRSFLMVLVAAWLAATSTIMSATPALAWESGPCVQGTGVTVVVNSDVRCVPHTGSAAVSYFSAAGHSLQRHQNFPTAICQINGAPVDGNCWGTDAYWGLFHSDGSSGAWGYASEGAMTLKVPVGAWVAFVWQNSSIRSEPNMSPVGPAPTPQATQGPQAPPDSPPDAGAEEDRAEGDRTEEAPAEQAPAPEAPEDDSVESPESSDKTKSTSQSTEAADDDGGGPLGLVVALIAVVLLGGAAFVVQRRRSPGA